MKKIEVLKADIEKYIADAAMLTKEIAGHDEDISAWTGDIKAATKVRGLEKADYDAIPKLFVFLLVFLCFSDECQFFHCQSEFCIRKIKRFHIKGLIPQCNEKSKLEIEAVCWSLPGQACFLFRGKE